MQYEELKKAIAKKGGNENHYKMELEKMKAAHEKDIHKFTLKITSLKEIVKDKDAELKEMLAKLKASAKDASKFAHMEEHIAILEREKDELKAKQKVDVPSVTLP